MQWKRLACLCLALLLLGSAADAFAAPRHNFPGLMAEFDLHPEQPEAMAHVFAPEAKVEAFGLTISIEGLYFDGKELLIGWKTNNAQPAKPLLVLYEDVWVDGVLLDADADFPLSSWWPGAFCLFVAADPINDLMDAFHIYDASALNLKGKQEVTCHFEIKRPTKPIAMVDAQVLTPKEDTDGETDRQAMLRALAACGVTVAPQDDLDPMAWIKRGYLVVTDGGLLVNDHGTMEDMAALNGSNSPDMDTADFVVRFTVDFDALAGR